MYQCSVVGVVIVVMDGFVVVSGGGILCVCVCVCEREREREKEGIYECYKDDTVYFCRGN